MSGALRRTVARVKDELRLFRNRIQKRSYTPPLGRVRWGDLRRTTPVAPEFGYRRGGPVDRYYIERFLDEHSADICGHVLEVGDDAYTRQFGGDAVVRTDVLHVDPDAKGATIIGRLEDDSLLAPASFDCMVLTQTLHLVYDYRAAARNVRRALAPGGVLLLTVPFITPMDEGEWASNWMYSFTDHALRLMCDECFPGCEVTLRSYGNVLAATAFLHGLGLGELTTAELDVHHVAHSVVHSLRVVVPAATDEGGAQ